MGLEWEVGCRWVLSGMGYGLGGVEWDGMSLQWG